jgi:hypothetical protein
MTDSLIEPTLDIRSFTTKDKECLNGALSFNNPIRPGGEIVPTWSTPTALSMPDILHGEPKVYSTSLVRNALDPDSVVFKHFHAPNLLVGHNTLHGTSVYAACQAFLWVCKIWLAQAGVSRTTLDALDLEHVSINGVDITYLQEYPSFKEADAQVRLLSLAARVSGRSEILTDKYKGNATSDFPFKEATITAYNKTDLSHCVFSSPDLKEQLTAIARRTLRIEIKLRQQELGVKYRQATAWKSAYADGHYEKLFKSYVLKSIAEARLAQRVQRPMKKAIDKALSSLKGDNRVWAQTVLNAYFAGDDLDELYVAGKGKAKPNNRYELREHFKETLKIDIEIAWQDYLTLAKSKVTDAFKYTGDYHPPKELMKECFCAENWGAIQARLRVAYEKSSSYDAGVPAKKPHKGIMSLPIIEDED